MRKKLVLNSAIKLVQFLIVSLEFNFVIFLFVLFFLSSTICGSFFNDGIFEIIGILITVRLTYFNHRPFGSLINHQPAVQLSIVWIRLMTFESVIVTILSVCDYLGRSVNQ